MSALLTVADAHVAYGKVEAVRSVSLDVGSDAIVNMAGSPGWSGSSTNGGWLIGGGIEYGFKPHWTVKLEYDYLGLGNRTFLIPAGSPFLAGDTFTTNNRNVQMVKVGVNYLFNWGAPVAARY